MIARRRFLTIMAGAAVLPIANAMAQEKVAQWRGIALGAQANIFLEHPNAQTLIAMAVREINRLENIFSLYRSDSQLSQLNQEGYLDNPAFEMVELLSICGQLNARTSGAFDPTVQRIWALYAEQMSVGKMPQESQINAAMELTGWQFVSNTPAQIKFGRVGMMLTLNGIAQGYIADKVSDLLKANGVTNVMINTGEIMAQGVAPNGAPWPVQSHSGVIPLRNMAIATSAPAGTSFDDLGLVGHIINPQTGYPGGLWSEVSVVSHSAAEADGLSTAFCLMPRPEIMAAKGNNDVHLLRLT